MNQQYSGPAAAATGAGAHTGEGRYREQRIRFWSSYEPSALGRYYHAEINRTFRGLVPPGRRVLEIGCGAGDLLASVEPSAGVGLDFVAAKVNAARERHPNLRFVLQDAHELRLDEWFDYVILSDLVNDLWDVQRVFEAVLSVCRPHTRIVLNAYSRLWEAPLRVPAWLGIAKPLTKQNWLTVQDLTNLLNLAGFEVIRTSSELIWPVRTPLIDRFSNRYLGRLWPFRQLALTNLLVARPQAAPAAGAEPLVSVVVAARNELGNIEQIFERVPEMGGGTEIVFVEGHSTDDTYAAIERTMLRYPHRRVKLFRQRGHGKGDAVRLGFREASGGVLMILDADLTVAPEDLPRFYRALRSGRGEFINGVRLVYPMDDGAMRFFNLLGNKFFSLAFSWLLGQSVKDTLCGTKVLARRDYEAIAANRQYFGDFDPFGDFDLIFGAAKLNLRIVDMPVRYGERTYGSSNIRRWSHGLLLFRMLLFAMRRIKFV